MRLVVIKETNTVLKDGQGYNDLDLSSVAFPENFWALQWYDNNTGHIEYNSPMIQNDEITSLPSWANDCIAIWQIAYDEEQAAIAAAIAAAEAEAQQEISE
jgi:hypothetical protein